MAYDDSDPDRDDAVKPKRSFRLLHATMVMLALLMASKLANVATGTQALLAVRTAEASSAAREEAPPAEEAGHDAAAPSEGGHGEEAKKLKEEMVQGTGKRTVKEIEALKARESLQPYTQSELDLLQNLAKRREELDAREQELALKSKVLEAAQKRINDKVAEMKALQEELTKIVAQYNEHQDKEIMSLVKIYENMKPIDAATIFNELDMPILIDVIDKMSERKVAPVLANMDPKRARDVTRELAEMRRARSATSSAAAGAAAGAAN